MNPFDPGYYTEKELSLMGFKAVGTNVLVAKNCTIIGLEFISIGNDVRIDGFSTIVASSGAALNIGSYVHIAGYVLLLAGGGIEISDFVGLSQGVKVYSKSDDYSGSSLTNPTVPSEYTSVICKKVVFEKHSIVGANSTVLPGVVVGEGVSVGANSLVTKSLDDWGIYFGNPVKRLKARSKHLLAHEQKLEESKIL